MGVSLIMVHFRLFNAYKRYKILIKVKDADFAITVSTQSDCYQLNSLLFFLIQKVYENYVYFISTSLTY